MKRRPFITFDCETDPFRWRREPRPFLWGAWDGATFQSWERTEDFAAWISTQRCVAYAHNGGKFDIHFLWPWIEPTELRVINGRVASCHIGACELRDSYCLLPVPLRAYNKRDIEYWKLEEVARPRHWAEILRYLEWDCRYLFEMISAFRAKHAGDPLTLAGAGFRALYKSLGKSERRPSSPEAYDAEYRRWYNGGRVESLRRGKVPGPVHISDIRSSYPYGMATAAHPWGTARTVFGSIPCNQVKPAGLYRIVARSRGCLPSKGEDGRVIYYRNAGRREYRCTGHELRAGLDTGTLEDVEIIEAHHWNAEVSFRGFVDFWYGEKLAAEKAGDAGGRLVAKLTMNAGQGKAGSDCRRYHVWRVATWDEAREFLTPLHPEGWTLERELPPMPGQPTRVLLRRDLAEQERHFVNVATAASILGEARARLWRAWCAVEAAGCPVVYSDTDCLHTTGDRPPLDYGDALGQWEHEEEPGGIWYARRKVYAGAKHSACKGARLTAAQIRRVACGAPVVWTSDSPSYQLGGVVWLQRLISLDPVPDGGL